MRLKVESSVEVGSSGLRLMGLCLDDHGAAEAEALGCLEALADVEEGNGGG
jgi:hypothetical protein